TRPAVSEVSSTCGGGFTELSKLSNDHEFLGTTNELQLISVRGSAAFDKDFNDPEVIDEFSGVFICDHHRNELSLQWTQYSFPHFIKTNDGKPKCSYPDTFHGDKRPLTKRLNTPSASVTVDEAKAVMKLERILLPVGLPVCPHHKSTLEQAIVRMNGPEVPTNDPTGPLRSGNE
ncbi:hypothetical protein PFISCL1PPCAC_15153, partial [Pristionchus fissidentatus]